MILVAAMIGGNFKILFTMIIFFHHYYLQLNAHFFFIIFFNNSLTIFGIKDYRIALYFFFSICHFREWVVSLIFSYILYIFIDLVSILFPRFRLNSLRFFSKQWNSFYSINNNRFTCNIYLEQNCLLCTQLHSTATVDYML